MEKVIDNILAAGRSLGGIVIALMAAIMVSSCNEAENDSQMVNQSISLDISMEGWDRLDATRASYSAMSESSGNKLFGMSFTSGDAIGLFACDKTGKVVIANQKFTYSGSSWSTETPIEYVTGLSGYTFFAYYPWVSSLSGAPAINSTPDISSAESFFSSAISAWTPSADQSTLAAFTGSDLMVAKGTNTMPYFHEVSVSFSMAHQMALAVTQPELTFYDINDPSYTWTVTQTFTGNIPYQIGSNYYYLVKPGVETTIGAKSATLAVRQVEQLFFTNMEPGKVEYDGEKKNICLNSVKLGSSPTYTYSVSSDLGSTWGSWTSTKPSWLTHDNTVADSYTTKIGIITASSTSRTTSLGTGNARNVPGDAILKTATPVSNVDLSMVDNAGVARASRTTANCYLVHAPGTYKIPLVYGNAIKNGDETSTSSFYTTQTSNTLQRLVNHADEGITSPWIKTQLGSCPDGAQLVWEDVLGMISSVGIDNTDNGYLTFTVDADNIAEGNAVIAATLSGTVVWSWHIWMTPETLTNLTSIDTGSHTDLSGASAPYRVASVNVGQVNGSIVSGATIYAGDLCKVKATANGVTVEFQVTAKDYTYGGTTYLYPSPYYQWGRKDAMYPSTGGYNSAGTLINTYSGLTLVTETSATPGATIQHPDYWYYTSYGPYGTDATYKGKRNYWDMNKTSTGNIATATVKTVYDPCPPGFCVPTGNLYYYASSNKQQTAWQSTPPGRNWTVNGTPIFFPAVNQRNMKDGSWGQNDYGYYWSASANSDNSSKNLSFYQDNWWWSDGNRSLGRSIRPVLEE